MKSILSFSFATAIAIFTLVGTIAATYYFLFSFGSEDERVYLSLMEASDPSSANTAILPYTAKQHRHNIHKAMWINSDKENRQISVRSEDADLVLDRHDESTEVIEHMRNVQCYMQEELYYLLPDGREAIKSNGALVTREGESVSNVEALPMQIIRYLEADGASYYYKTDQLIAEQVTLSRYAVGGHELVESLDNIIPLMTGVAHSMECTLDGQSPKFKANQVKAVLYRSGT